MIKLNLSGSSNEINGCASTEGFLNPYQSFISSKDENLTCISFLLLVLPDLILGKTPLAPEYANWYKHQN